MNPPSATALRRTKRSARRALTPHEQQLHARAVARHLAASKLLLCFKRFAVYAPSDGELDPSPIAEHLLAANKVVTLPVVEHRSGSADAPPQRLSFYRYRNDTPLVRNRFGINEPDTRRATHVPTAILDVVLLPLVAFDDAGYRLGMGGGFYDATFQHVHRRALLIGLAHELQHSADVPHRRWDVPLDGVITERAMRGFTIRGRRFMTAAL